MNPPENEGVPKCEVESSVFTPPGDVSPAVAEYDVGKLLDLHADLKQLSRKDKR